MEVIGVQEVPGELVDQPLFDPDELNIPPSTQLVAITGDLEELGGDPSSIRAYVSKKYVPDALVAYGELLGSGDPKIKKATADSILEIANVKDSKGAPSGVNVVNFNLGAEQKGLLFGALGALSSGEIVQVAELVEGDEDEG